MGVPKGPLVMPIGYNPSGLLRALELDASDRLLVNVGAVPSPLSLFTFDGSGRLYVNVGVLPAPIANLTLDGSNYLQVNAKVLPAPVANLQLDGANYLYINVSDPAKGLVGAHSRYGSAWVKQPLIEGVTDVFRVLASNTDLAAGISVLTGVQVPANFVYVAESFGIRYVGTITGVSVQVEVYDGANAYPYYTFYPAVSGNLYHQICSITAKAGETYQVRVIGATLHDDLYFYLVGRTIASNL